MDASKYHPCFLLSLSFFVSLFCFLVSFFFCFKQFNIFYYNMCVLLNVFLSSVEYAC